MAVNVEEIVICGLIRLIKVLLDYIGLRVLNSNNLITVGVSEIVANGDVEN